MLLPTLALALLSAGWTARAGGVRKCCGPEQNFDPGFNCVNRTIETNDTAWWFPSDTNVSKMAVGEALYGSPPCSPDEQLWLYHIQGDSSPPQFSFVASSNEVMLWVTGDYAPKEHFSPPGDYCVDAIEYAGLEIFGVQVCPCDNAPCIRKCCASSQAFDASMTCVEKTIKDWTPVRETIKTEQKHVILLGKIPKCEVPHSILFGNSSIFQLNDEYNMVQRTKSRQLLRQGLKPQEYCGDLLVEDDDEVQEVLVVCLRAEVSGLEQSQGVLLLLGGTLLASAAAVQTLCVLPARVRRRVHARLSMCHNASLALGFLVLGGHKLHPHIQSLALCRVLGKSLVPL